MDPTGEDLVVDSVTGQEAVRMASDLEKAGLPYFAKVLPDELRARVQQREVTTSEETPRA
jgi:hypothetical protein